PSRQLEEQDLRQLLADAIGKMPKQERQVLSLMFHEELSLREISRVMDLHESRISQIKVKALQRMRTLVEKEWPMKGARAASAQRTH
ncbi:MAG: sigma-70 family RNA polymerase sigma factor, partial [Bryobacteraceae bacterium]|nr:sigma-70 family RNA polymerase sigma factor [Bryobacteraceae bacterium]